MKDYNGNIENKIWLIGDSPPLKWKDKLSYPLDPKHPSVHNIWTPIFDRINNVLFDSGLRLDDKLLYVRNAVNDASIWEDDSPDRRNKAIDQMRDAFDKNKPVIVITFGSRAYEIVRQAICSENENIEKLKEWSSRDLGKKFCENIGSFEPDKINILPLLHVSVSRGRFLVAQANFCKIKGTECYKNGYDDYFTCTGERIAGVLKQEAFHKYCRKRS